MYLLNVTNTVTCTIQDYSQQQTIQCPAWGRQYYAKIQSRCTCDKARTLQLCTYKTYNRLS